jgi:hypothetical protein
MSWEAHCRKNLQSLVREEVQPGEYMVDGSLRFSLRGVQIANAPGASRITYEPLNGGITQVFMRPPYARTIYVLRKIRLIGLLIIICHYIQS